MNDYSTPLFGVIRTSFSHRAFTLTARTSFVFAIFLITLLSTSFWFQWNAEYLGILAVVISLILTHFLLLGAESNVMSALFSFMRKGQPVVVYKRWLQVEDNTIVFGICRLLWTAIDSVSVSHFGNLIFTSRALCGPPILENNKDYNPASKVLKIPFAAIDLQTQKRFIALLRTKCPQAQIAPSLAAIMDKPILRSTNYIYIFTVLVWLLVLLDVGYSTFRYVELLKRYYLADQAAISGDIQKGEMLYQAGEQLRMHTPVFSMVSRQLFSKGQSLATVQEARSRALWALGQKEKALFAQQDAARLMPKSHKIVLCQARLCLALGKVDEAQKVINSLIDRHKHSLLPRLYLAYILWRNNKTDEAKLGLKKYLAMLDEEYFSPPPVWPASGEESLHELFYCDDLKFLFADKLLSTQNHY